MLIFLLTYVLAREYDKGERGKEEEGRFNHQSLVNNMGWLERRRKKKSLFS